jgi:hypothetical protein
MVSDEGRISPPAHVQASQLMWGFIATQAVHVAAKLAVFDLIANAPADAPHFAETKEEVVVQIIGIGPTATVYNNRGS